ncbi:MAG: cytochrome c family protein, partial [Alphaproteobacteria bacterium]|nr:cytochrome c family protein [Alphaproteobacteria bacterium]
HDDEKKGYPIAGVVSEDSGATPAAVPIATLLAKADPAKGQAVFAKCTSCHTDAAGAAALIGPNLYGVVGRPVGSFPGFAYSDAVKGLGGKWDFDRLNQWLTSPSTMAPGTKMGFAGIDSDTDRANLIAWLNTQGSNLPLPAPPAASAKAVAAK